jgi:hypothetical protein
VIRNLLIVSLCLAIPTSAMAMGTGGSIPGSKGGGAIEADVGNTPGLGTAVIIGAIPSVYFTIASLVVGPKKVAEEKPWWNVVGAASGVAIIFSGIGFVAANPRQPQLAMPFMITGLVAGIPSLGLATYGWLARDSAPTGTITILSKNDVTLAPPMPTVFVTPSGSAAPGLSILNGRF